MGDSINQDDIDRLLQESAGGGDPAPAAPAPAAPSVPADLDLDGVANQDDIDALFASVGADPAPAAGHIPDPEPPPAPPPDPVFEGIANQDDIDALFSAVSADPAPAAAPADEPAPIPSDPAPEADFEGVANQDDIDALFSAVGGDGDAAPAPEASVPDAAPAPADHDDLHKMIDSSLEDADRESATDTKELDELLSSIADESGGDGHAPFSVDSAMNTDTEDLDMDALLREVSAAAPPPPPERLPAPTEPADTAVLDMGLSAALAAAEAGHFGAPLMPPPGPQPAPAQEPPAAPAPAPQPVPQPVPADLPPLPALPAAAARREFSVLYGAGEVDSVASQINALLNSMSEKAHSYMQAWIAADSEAKELRSRALVEERRRSSLESEKLAIGGQLDEMRARLAELEGGKIASEEAKRTLETTYQSKIREMENQVKLLSSESEALKDELTRARNEATGVDIESRRARFEVDRLKNEVESERMERLRIQRALENREKELQATQAQAAGQASSLFIDELHRLVRRLESELDARASGAHEALKQLDRLETSEEMVPVAANLRAALMQALGRDAEANDALKSLGREASGVKGPAAVAAEKTEIVSFETALATYNLTGAVDVAGALLRETRATPAVLMRKIYQCPALRRPEVVEHLPDLARLLEGLRTIQEANDRARGSESGEAEIFHVHLFDFLHNLVKLKLINRMSGDMWRIFLDLRGRFSFVNSDRQWAEYRDRTLGDSAARL